MLVTGGAAGLTVATSKASVDPVVCAKAQDVKTSKAQKLARRILKISS
jgi:hypothetical protein